MSDGKSGSNLAIDGDTVEITLEEIPPRRYSRSSRKSSTSTSSFEDVNTARFDKNGVGATTNEAPDKPSRSGALTFKTTSLDDPTYYAQTASLTSTPAVNSARQHVTPSDLHAPARSTRVGIDGDRDPENVNEIVKIRFEEVFAEPEGAYSFGTIWGASFRIFTDTKQWCYKFLSAMFAVPCAFCWGLHFACLSFCQIWYYQPTIRSIKVQIRPLSRVYGLCVKTFIEPCFEAFGRLFSNIRIYQVQE